MIIFTDHTNFISLELYKINRNIINSYDQDRRRDFEYSPCRKNPINNLKYIQVIGLVGSFGIG